MDLVAEALSKSYGATRALRGASLRVAAGRVACLIGHNGAGKSTLIRILATLMRPDAGKASLGEVDLLGDARRARMLVGYLGHESMLDGALTVRENLRLFASLYGVKEAQARVETLIERFGAARFADSPVNDLSRGQEQAAGLCRALLHDPRLLLLDEPATGLDTAARERLWQVARESAAGGAVVVFSTHDVEGASRIADSVIELMGGEIVNSAR